MNKVELEGKIGREPIFRETKNGNEVVSFSLMTTNPSHGAGGSFNNNVAWPSIVMWGDVAEKVRDYLKKGERLHIIGHLSTRSYEDKQGIKKYVTEVVADLAKSSRGGEDSSFQS